MFSYLPVLYEYNQNTSVWQPAESSPLTLCSLTKAACWQYVCINKLNGNYLQTSSCLSESDCSQSNSDFDSWPPISQSVQSPWKQKWSGNYLVTTCSDWSQNVKRIQYNHKATTGLFSFWLIQEGCCPAFILLLV